MIGDSGDESHSDEQQTPPPPVHSLASGPLVLHICADDTAGMLFSAGVLYAAFLHGALKDVRVLSCSGLGAVVIGALLSVCEDLFDQTNDFYALDPNDPIHVMAVHQFLATVRKYTDTQETQVDQLSRFVDIATACVWILSVATVATVGVVAGHLDLAARVCVFGLSLCMWALWVSATRRRMFAEDILNECVSDSSFGSLSKMSVLIPCVVRHGGRLTVQTNSSAWSVANTESFATDYVQMGSLRAAVLACISQDTSSMKMDPAMLGPITTFYTLHRMPFKCDQGRTILFVDAWTDSQSYHQTPSLYGVQEHSAKRVYTDAMFALMSPPDVNGETPRLATTQPVVMFDRSQQVEDCHGRSMRRFYRAVHAHRRDRLCGSAWTVDLTLAQNTLQWGYLAMYIRATDAMREYTRGVSLFQLCPRTDPPTASLFDKEQFKRSW